MTKVVSYGGGTNSFAMLIGLFERGERPDLILFADTGGELPETYKHVAFASKWCLSIGFPPIVVVSEDETLEQDCLRRNALPGIAYGFKSCSEHYKIRPQKRHLKQIGVDDAWFWVGLDAGEAHRKRFPETRYPLIEWNWDREACIAMIALAGLPQPGKTSCFFCPNAKQGEILKLKREHPELLARAIHMEQNADLTVIKGLGRTWSWEQLAEYDESQIDLFGHSPQISCDCVDGIES